MDQAAPRPSHASTSFRLAALAGVGAALSFLAFVADLILPRLQGSAESALVDAGPWAWPVFAALRNVPSMPSLALALSLALLASFVGGYVVALWLARSIRPSREVFLVAVTATGMACGLILMSPPARKADLFYYAFQGRMIVRDQVNPYVVAPRAEEGDSWFPLLSPTWRDLATGYGPSSLLASAAIDLAVDRGGAVPDATRAVLAFRGLFVGLTVANVALIWLILGYLAPSRRTVGILSYAWNPAVLLVGVEHNDTLMLFLALLGLWLFLRHRSTLAVIALSLSVLVKYYTLPLLIGLLIGRWRSEDGTIARWRLPLVALTTSMLMITPFDPLAIAPHVPTYLTESGRLAHLAQPPFELVVGLVALVGARFARLDHTHRIDRILEDAMLALFVYLAVLSRDWFPWYLVTAIALASLIGGWWLDVAATMGGSWLLGLNQDTAYLTWLLQQHVGLDAPTSVAILLFGPALAVGFLGALWRSRHRSDSVLFSLGLVALVAFTVPTVAPLVASGSAAPPLADLGGGRPPGPVVFGTTLEWDDWSWGVKVVQIGTPPGPDAPRSLCVTFGPADGALYAHHPGFSTHGYTSLTLLLDPANVSPSVLRLLLRGQNGAPLGQSNLDQYLAPGNQSRWQRVRVPLSALGASDTTVTGVLLESSAPAAGQPVCLQSLEFSH